MKKAIIIYNNGKLVISWFFVESIAWNYNDKKRANASINRTLQMQPCLYFWIYWIKYFLWKIQPDNTQEQKIPANAQNTVYNFSFSESHELNIQHRKPPGLELPWRTRFSDLSRKPCAKVSTTKPKPIAPQRSNAKFNIDQKLVVVPYPFLRFISVF